MRTSGKFTNIQIILKKIFLSVLLTGVCPLFAATYRWTGATDTNWSTATNWKTYNNSSWETAASAPGSSDDVIIKTSTMGTDPINPQDISITLDTNVTINGLISFGLGKFTITSTNQTFNATTVFIGSSAHNYRTSVAPAVIPGLPDIDYITENHQGNINIEGSTTVNIKNLDTSSWTKNNTKNVVSINDTSILIVSQNWNTGGAQGSNTNRTDISKDSEATIAVTGEILGDDKANLTEGLDNSGAAVVETPVPEANQTNVYIWIGATDTNWSTDTNWLNNKVPDSTVAEVSIPQTKFNPTVSSEITVNTLTIAKGAVVTINDSLKINSNFTLENSTDINPASTGKVISNNTINIKSNYSSTTFSIESKNIHINASFQCKDLTILDTLTIDSGATLTLGGTTSIANIINNGTIKTGEYTLKNTTSYTGSADTIKIQSGSLEYSGSVEALINKIEITTEATIDGGTNGLSFTNATFNSSDITASGKISLPGGSVGNLTIDSGTTTLKEGTDLYANNITINSSASFTCIEGTDLYVSGNWTNNAGTSGFTCGTGTVYFTSNATIAGDSTFYNLTCTTGGTDLIFEAGSTQTISNQFTITGSTVSPITLKSSTPGSTWNINVAIEKASVTAAKIQDSVSENDSITATSSVSLGNNTNWKIPGTYKWENPPTEEWNSASNWQVLQLDGTYSTAKTYPQYEEDEIIIASTTKSAILPSNLALKQITVNEGATLDFADKNLTAANFTNNGTIRFSGINSITASASYGPSSTIEYYGSSPNAVTGTGAPSADDYKNLTITNGTILSLDANSITVSGTLSNEGTVLVNGEGVFNITGTSDSNSGLVKYTSNKTSTIPNIGFYNLEINAGDWSDKNSTGISIINNFTISGGSFTCNGNLTVNTLKVDTDSYVKFNNATGGQTSSASSAVFTKGKIFFGNDENDSFSVTGDGNSLSISGNPTFHTAGSLSGKNGITVGTDLTAVAATTFASAVTLTGNCTISSTISNGTNTINFSGTIDGGHALSTTGTGVVTLNKSVGNTTPLNSINFAGPVNINCAEIKTTGNQTYNNNLTLGNNVTISAESGNLITFAGTINGNSNDLTISTADSQFNGDISNVKNLSTSNVIFNGTTTNITTTENQSYLGNITLSGNSVLTGKNITFKGDASDSESPSSHNLTITNSGVFKTADDTNIICNTFTQNGAGKNMLGGSLTSASGTWGTDLYIYGNSDAQISGKQTISGNFIIAKDAQELKINSPVTASNVVLYSGNVTASANITSINDIVLLGSAYNVNDNVSGTENAYLYEQTRYSGNKTGIKNNYTLETKFPDNSAIPLKDSILTLTSGTLTSGQNFYANGLSISGKIKIQDNSDSASSFAEAYNCTVTDSTVSGGQIACENCTFNGSNSNWNQDPLIIEEAYTVRDNCVYIRFNRELRNKHGELNKAIADGFLTFSHGKFTGIYSDADCSSPITEGTEPEEFYLKAESSWNTDATGSSPGTEYSTDRTGSHQSSMPYIDIVRNIKNDTSHNWIITDIYGKRLDNYSTKTKTPGKSYGSDGDSSHGNYDTASHVVEDHTGPVLYSVRTGQEQHTPYDSSIGESSQPAYDAHNFIEFRYSEPVNFGNSTGKNQSDNLNIFDNTNLSADIWLPASGCPIENVRVNNTFGALSNESGLSFTGLAKIESGSIKTGTKGYLSKYVNSLYRQDPYSIKLSIAGYVDESNPVVDASGNTYKNWIGYIEESETPSGTVSAISSKNIYITDCALSSDGNVLYNPQIEYAEKVEPKVNYDLTGTPYPNTGVFGNWDSSAPCFAPYNAAKKWIETGYYEAIGTNGGTGSTLDRIEFHIFDNTPDFSSVTEPVWYFEKGWVKYSEDSSLPELYNPNLYAADTAGGARPWQDDSPTIGGLRFCSYLNSANAFKYTHNSNSTPGTAFDSDTSKVYQGTVSPIFISASGPSHTTNDPDSLYFALTLSELTLPVDTTFSVSYTADSSKGFITDLAGNRLKSAVIKTLDRTPPSFNITISPVNNKELYISFVKQIQTDSSSIRLLDNTTGNAVSISENFLTLLPQCFEIIEIQNDGSGTICSEIAIDNSIPAEIIDSTSNDKFSSIKLTLTKEVTLDNIKNLYIRLRRPENYNHTFKDHLTSISDSNVTLIQDNLGNYMKYHSAHALSDFAVNVINPLYAYDEEFNNDSTDMMSGIYEEGSWAVHDFNQEQQNYGTLSAGHPFSIVASAEDGTTEKSMLPEKVKIYLSASPDAKSISTQYNSDFDAALRIWLPKISFKKNNRNFTTTFSSISSSANTNYLTCDSKLINENNLSDGLIFNISSEIIQNWESGNQISFLFSLQDENNNPVTIYSSPYLNVDDTYSLTSSTPYPLFALRLKEASDITSIDLWSVKLKNITEQRGGVTILNNVINSTAGEKTIIKVNTAKEGMLTVAVMTLDGNIVQYIHKGNTTAGEHYYSWNGKTKNGKPVARGMYFVRVFGKDIDETRKIMVVQ
ncbi:MAG: FlgD immunoglobulin-like domain containing protein [Treponema sp.]|nr:FlgD immunoglobulin-like domain containing protein [Treponema sp.]